MQKALRSALLAVGGVTLFNQSPSLLASLSRFVTAAKKPRIPLKSAAFFFASREAGPYNGRSETGEAILDNGNWRARHETES